MSSVRKKDQSEHRFTVLDKCLDLYDHTTTVTANPKFQQCPTLTDRLNDEAAMIYHLCRCANEDLDARDKQEAAMRMNLQAEALGHCKWLKTYIMLAQRKLHLRAKIIILADPKKVKRERKKIKRMVAMVQKGKLTKRDVDRHFKAYKASVSYGNSHNLIYRLNRWYESLWKG